MREEQKEKEEWKQRSCRHKTQRTRPERCAAQPGLDSPNHVVFSLLLGPKRRRARAQLKTACSEALVEFVCGSTPDANVLTRTSTRRSFISMLYVLAR
ncbi:hypothetical protein EYF80_035259 [Liparis tanakae]|uniref:Uncharacterized protein n=1 Tax=Liparis tanakae TaxID=230148 RepID=A0A4Z2GM19_9TELE|nr:hypothetical protein EYF80_035259 [Liparis tanakae]